MTAWMYAQCGVQRPVIDSGTVSSRATLWSTATTEVGNTTNAIDVNRKHVLSLNDSDTSKNFDSFVSSNRSARYGTEEYAKSAGQFAVALNNVSTTVASAVKAMDTTAISGHQQVMIVWLKLFTSAAERKRLIDAIIAQTKSALVAQQTHYAAQIVAAYAAVKVTSLPDATSLAPSDDPDRGVVDMTIKDDWANLSEEDRKKILTEMIREYARQHGLNPDDLEISFDVEYVEEPEGSGNWVKRGGYGYNSGNKIWLNPDMLTQNDPALFHTAVHETQHAVQGKVDKIYDGLSEQDKADIRAGKKEDPFKEYGATLDQAEVWDKNWDNPYITDPWPDYHAQPVETDARRAGREEGAGMSPDEYERIKKQAGVK